MMSELRIFPHERSVCSPLIVGEIIFVVTPNGVGEGHRKLPSPQAPSFIALNKKDGKLLWMNNVPGNSILHGQWTNPTYAEINGVEQVIFPGGDGWLYSFVPETGIPIWKFDCNSKDAMYEPAGLGTRNHFVGSPVFYDNKIYIGTGDGMGAPCEGSGTADFICVAPSKRGDISKSTISGRGEDGKPLNEKPNPNSCEVWRYGGAEYGKWAQRDCKIESTSSTSAIVDNIVYITEQAGILHCIDARTGKHYWQFDTKASIWGSPYYVDGKILVANAQGDLFVFKHLKTHQVYDEVKAVENAKNMKEARQLRMEVQKQVAEKYLLSKTEFDAPIRTTPVVANGRLYVMTEKNLYAIRCGK